MQPARHLALVKAPPQPSDVCLRVVAAFYAYCDGIPARYREAQAEDGPEAA